MKTLLTLVVVILAVSACTPASQGTITPDPEPDETGFVDPTRPPYDVAKTYAIPEQGFTLELSYNEGSYFYYGSVQTPTPCHKITVDTFIAESYPEQVTLNVVVTDSGDVCSQVIDNKVFSGEIVVSEQASFNIQLAGEPASLTN